MIKGFPLSQGKIENNTDVKKFFKGVPIHKKNIPVIQNSIYSSRQDAIDDSLVVYCPVVESSGNITYNRVNDNNAVWQGQTISSDAPHENFQSRYHASNGLAPGVINSQNNWETDFEEYTISFWQKRLETADNKWITCSTDNTNNWAIDITSTSIIIFIYIGGNPSVTLTNVPINQWNFWTIRKSATNFSVAINGTENELSANLTGTNTSLKKINLCAHPPGTDSWSGMKHNIAEIAIWKKKISDTFVNEIYSKQSEGKFICL